MNERIKQLATEAENYAHEQNELYGVSYILTYEQKFAELIVRECCQFENSYGGDAGLVARSYSRKIREHFGVEQ